MFQEKLRAFYLPLLRIVMDARQAILFDREQKHLFVQKYVNDYQVVVIKANIPGLKKQCKESYMLVNLYHGLICKMITPEETFFLDGEDGPAFVLLYCFDTILKKDMQVLEEETSLGRFVDIDVFYKKSNSCNRAQPRKCFICDQPAFVCNRLGRHSLDDLQQIVAAKCFEYLKHNIFELVNDSMLRELNLVPKFGLVTPTSSGSHKDMDYSLMVKAKDKILPYFVAMFMLGYQMSEFSLDEIFIEAQRIGLLAEKEMFLATKGVNAYKGLIFNLGLLLINCGVALARNLPIEQIYGNVQQMVKNLPSTIGAVNEAKHGYENVSYICRNYKLNDDHSLLPALVDLIRRVDDSIMMKRSGSVEKYYQIKDSFAALSFDAESLKAQTKMCIENNLSFGGCADLLVLAIFMQKFCDEFRR